MNRIGPLTGVLGVAASIVTVRRVEASLAVTVYLEVAAWLAILLREKCATQRWKKLFRNDR